MPTEADRQFEALIQTFESVVSAFVAPGQSYALLDFPDHVNIGDSAIWSGEVAFFDRYVGRAPSYVCSHVSKLDGLEAHAPEGPVFIHGGGNFGDTWPNHQNFRHHALQALKGRQLVQLAQSIHFSDDAKRDETARLIAGHDNFTLLVRDQESFDLAQAHFDCETVMCPDAAVNLHMLPAPDAQIPLISFLREDHESVWREAHEMLAAHGPVVDWPTPNVLTHKDRVLRKLLSLTPLTAKAAIAHKNSLYNAQAWARVQAGVVALSQGELIVSDRLHVHLISSLMRRPHIVLDNMYGKIGRHMAAWGDFGLAEQVGSAPELQDVLKARLTP